MDECKLSALPVAIGDVARFCADLLIHGLASIPAAIVFCLVWATGVWWARFLAFAAAFAVLSVAFPLVVILFSWLAVPKVRPGTYPMRSSEAVRWIIAESLVILVHRSFLRGYIEDFELPRRIYHRMLGAKIGRNFFVGGEARILDPWALEVGDNALVGTLCLISGHVIEGEKITIKPVRIGSKATIGMRAILLPGADIGAGAIVGAGALVTKDTIIPPGEIWAGVPARKIGEVAVARPDDR